MGTVLNFGDFKKRQKKKHTEQYVNPDALLVFSPMLGSLDAQQILDKLVRRDDRHIRAYKRLVESYSSEEICAWLESPKDQDLQKEPHFYHALIDEAKNRFLTSPTQSGESPE